MWLSNANNSSCSRYDITHTRCMNGSMWIHYFGHIPIYEYSQRLQLSVTNKLVTTTLMSCKEQPLKLKRLIILHMPHNLAKTVHNRWRSIYNTFQNALVLVSKTCGTSTHKTRLGRNRWSSQKWALLLFLQASKGPT